MQLRRMFRLALSAVLSTLVLGQVAVVQAATPTLVLPDLAMIAPVDVRLEFTSDGRRLLRFSTIQVNIGAGPFQAVGFDPTDGNAGVGDVLSVKQQIKRSDGTWIDRATTAKMQWAGDGHNHWHIVNYQQFKIQTLTGTSLRFAAKTGFCAFDNYVYGSTKAAFYSWEKTCKTKTDGTVFMGTSRLWGDKYRWDIAFQWIDITGLASGDYRIRVIADPPYDTGGRFKESNETNNYATTKIRLTSRTVTVLSRSARP